MYKTHAAELVAELGNYVFNGCSSLTSVALPDGLTQPGGEVFDGWSSLTSVAHPRRQIPNCWQSARDCRTVANRQDIAELLPIRRRS